MTNEREIRVTFRRAVSDGNFGTEAAEVTMQQWLDETDDIADDLAVVAQLQAEAKQLVYGQLRESLSAKVRAAVDDPEWRQERERLATIRHTGTGVDEIDLAYPGAAS